MLRKTRGIVLSYVRYKDSSIIVKVFTEQFGLRTYIVNGVRKKNKGNKLIFYQPMSMLELVVYENEKKDINRISEVRFFHRPVSIPFEVKKSSVALFLCEFLEKIMVEEEINPLFFEFLVEQLIVFDGKVSGFENFHLNLLIGLTKIQGIGIETGSDLVLSGHHLPVSEEAMDKVDQLLNNPDVPLNGHLRKEILEALIQYFQGHLGTFGNIKSLKVLSEVMG